MINDTSVQVQTRPLKRWESVAFAKKLYEKAPWYLQNVLISSYGYLLQRRLTSRDVQTALEEYLQTQWYSLEQLLDMQTEKLVRLIQHAYSYVPYYRRVMDENKLKPEDICTLADLEKLPLLTKKDVRDHKEEMIAQNMDRRKMNPHHTSGTTGLPLDTFVSYRDAVTERALNLRMRTWAGWHPGERRITFPGYQVVPISSKKPPYWRHDWSENRLFLSIYHLTKETMPMYVDTIRAFNPKILEAYPFYSSYLARYLDQVDEKIPLQVVFSAAEPLYPFERELLEERFSCKVYDWYGMTERAVCAAQCEETNGFHTSMEKSIFEIVKPDGTIAAPGEQGEIVGTNLEEYGMPLIRYRTGDLSSIRPEPCPCGRAHPLMDQVTIRANDVLRTADGRQIHFFPLISMFQSKAINKGRIIQEDLDRVTVLLDVENGVDIEEQKERFITGIKKILGEGVQVKVELVDEIPAAANGKYPFIQSKLSRK